MSQSGRPVIPLVLNRRVEIKNKAALKTTKTSAGQQRQDRGDIKHTQIQPNRWFVSAITLTHISGSNTHTSGSCLGVSCYRSSPLHHRVCLRKCVWNTKWNQTEHQWSVQIFMCLHNTQVVRCNTREINTWPQMHMITHILTLVVPCKLIIWIIFYIVTVLHVTGMTGY